MGSRLRLTWWTALALAPALAAPAAGELPEGLRAAPSALLVAGRLALAVWGAALLLLARRRPRLAVGSFFLLAGAGLGAGLLAAVAYPLAGLAAALVLAFGLALHAVAPRIAMAAALSWPLPALLAAGVALGGGMAPNRHALLALLVVGAALGALLPEASVGVLGAALGTALLARAWPGELAILPLAALFAVGIAWQAVLPRVLRPPLLERRPVTRPERQRAALAAARAGALAAVAGLVVLVLLAPLVTPERAGHAARLEKLRAATGGRPALLLSPAGSFYLSGVAHPVALVADSGSLGARLGVLLRGRSCSRELARLRAVKDEEELAALRRAAAITASAQRAAAALVRPGANERDLEAAVLAAYAAGGATGVAFRSIVASGANAVLPHYQRNDAELRAGLVVVDIGCSVDGYAADITRTFPVAGEWSETERRLLDAVLTAKEEARAALKPGASLRALNRRAHAAIDRAGFGKYFIHGLSHHVGIEVHDAHVDELAAGMVVTIEPGIYIPAGSAIGREFWNLGIRIEDTYLVTPEGGVALAELPEVLPAGAAAAAGS
jgi:Xaa-Pro aminopeptidase